MQQLSNNAFSIRRLNPFNGLLQVYQLDSARALSANGQVWEIQVLSDTPQGLWANTPFGAPQYFSFGLWSETSGLKQVPVNPLFDIRSMISASDRLIDSLKPALARLPFTMLDHYELWLLDESNQQPLALLHSCRMESEMELNNIPPKWIAADQGDFSFVSPHLSRRGLPNHDGYNPRVHTSVLEAEVQHRAGFQPRTAWFYRDSDSGIMDVEGDRTIELRFPNLPLLESGYDDENAQLIDDYIVWKAPQLLMLPDLSDTTRERLEKMAVKQPEQIDRLWLLYPEIHNNGLLKRARVEARIRIANRN
ncbi:MAG: hypothetical protein ABW170_08085 [Candidatus Thiodiazotropha sp. L084R]